MPEIRVYTFAKSVSANSEENLKSDILGSEPIVPEGLRFTLKEIGGTISADGAIDLYHGEQKKAHIEDDVIPSVNDRLVLNNVVDSKEKFTLVGVDESGGTNDMYALLVVEVESV